MQTAMMTALPYAALRDAMLTHPTFVEGLIPLFSSLPSTPQPSDSNENRHGERNSTHLIPNAVGQAN
jgi:hypothetical protein